MAVKLSEFCEKLILERKIVRANKGNSIVPLMMIRVTHEIERHEYDWLAGAKPLMLVTVCRKTGTMFVPRSNDMLYSAGGALYYSNWWNLSEVVSIRPPQLLSRNLLEVYIRINEATEREEPDQPNPW